MIGDARQRWGARLEWALVVGLAALFLWKGFLVGWAALNTDFPNYYLGGKLFRAGWPLERFNDWIWLQRQKDHAGLDQALVGYLPSTLWSTLIIVPLTWLSPLAAKRVWLLVNLALLLGVGGLLRHLTRLPMRRIALMVLVAVVPLRTNFQFGQQHVVVLLLLTLATWAYFHDRPALSGMALAFGAALKLYPALFVLLFWRKRRWRALLWLVGSSLALASIGLALFGRQALQDYLVTILPRSLKGEFNDPYITNLNSLTAWLRRLFVREPDLNPLPLADAPGAFVVLQPVLQALLLVAGLWTLDRGERHLPPDKQKLDWAGFCFLLLLLSTGTSTYHLCAIVLPLTLAFDCFAGAAQVRRAWWLWIGCLLACLPYGHWVPSSPSGWRILLGFPRLYALVAVWLLVLTSAWRARSAREGARTGQERLAWSLVFAAWAAVSLASNWRHFAGQFANYPSRLPVAEQPLIATTPVQVAGDLYFTRMADVGYLVDRLPQPLKLEIPAGADLFFPTATAGSDDAWAELAGTTSKIVRFPRSRSLVRWSDLVVEVEDAQQAAISPDARWLGFIRVRNGRGGLWVLDRRTAPSSAGGWPREREVLGSASDVLDFSFLPDGRIVLASQSDGRATLSIIDPIAHPIVGDRIALDTGGRSARYPAASPDGAWLAYAQLERGQWQLWQMNLQTRARRQLTSADCNSVLPSWSADSRQLVYASDCGRGVGHTALCRIPAGP
jgi:hypothetical protein